MRVLQSILFSITIAWAFNAVALDANEEAAANTPPATFLVYSVTWQPTFCKMQLERGKDACKQIPQAFLPHGIWPYSESVGDRTNRHPQFCTTSPACNSGDACEMGPEDVRTVLSNEPLRDLVTHDPAAMFAHEWKKHGTCSGKKIQAYFQDFVDFRPAVKIKDKPAFEQMIGTETEFADIRKVFPTNTSFRCYRDAKGEQYLHEVFYLIDSEGQPYQKERNLQIGIRCAEEMTWIPRDA